MEINMVQTLPELVKYAAEQHGDSVFIKEKSGKEIVEKSFSRFFTDSCRVAAFLNSASNGETIHTAVIGATSSAYLTAYFGSVCSGNVAVPLDAQLACEDLCELINRADVSVVFFDERFSKMIPQIRTSCPNVRTYVSLQPSDCADICLTDILGTYEPADIKTVSPDDISSIVYTSGTTGKAKGVMLSHGNFIDNTMCCDGEGAPGDALLTVLPIHHVYCFTCDILLSLRYGTTVCVNDSMLRIAQNLKLFSPSIILLVPMIAATIYKQIMAAAAQTKDVPAAMVAKAVFGGNLKVIYSGGAYLSPEIINGYAELGIPIMQGYGMTECAPRISSVKLGDCCEGDVGTVVKGCEVRIVDGEIMVKSPSVMKGYYKDPVATAEALTADGWLHTGDLGYVDEHNRIFITGRKKNLIILSNGENVSPEELENKFATVPLAAEVLVYAEDGVITAEVYPGAEALAEYGISGVGEKLNEEIKRINTTLTSSKTIRRLRVRDVEFDKTTSKKVKRAQTIRGELI